MFIHIIIHILLWGVIHFQQIYLECMLLFAMSVSFHLTSVWLCVSVVFVVTVQWPIGKNMTSPFSLFINTYPFSMSLKTIHFASYPNLQNTWKIWRLAMKKFEIFCFVQSVNHQLSAMCKCSNELSMKEQKNGNCTLIFKSSTGQGDERVQVPKCELCIHSIKEIYFRFLRNSNYFDNKALSKRIIDQ